ncbi:MAG: hypothetical protein ACRCSQ_07610 [Bacteroidales bacterium]
MNTFVPISRELINSSLWRSLAGTEVKILMELLALAPFKATTYNLYGVDIELEKHELCFSCVKMAEKYDISYHSLRRLIDKLAKHKILVKKKRKIDLKFSHEKNHEFSHEKNHEFRNPNITSITFCGWVFGEKNIDEKNSSKVISSEMSSVKRKVTYKKEVIKEELNKEKIFFKHNVCEDKNEIFQKAEKPKKVWYPIDEIANLEFPKAEALLKTWCEFSGQTNIQIKPLLHKYCNEQKLININQMTLDIFDYRFRKYMNRTFRTKSKKVEPIRVTNYL